MLTHAKEKPVTQRILAVFAACPRTGVTPPRWSFKKGRVSRIFQAGRGEISRRAPLCRRVISREGFAAACEVPFRAATRQSSPGSLFSLGRSQLPFPARAKNAAALVTVRNVNHG